MPEAANAIYTQHYVDDYSDSLPDEETPMKLIHDVTYIYMHKEIFTYETGTAIATLSSTAFQKTPSIAVQYGLKSDCSTRASEHLDYYGTLGFDVSLKKISENIINGEERPTKTDILRVIM